VARLEANVKGQDVLIEALSADQWKQRDWRLTLYGSGPDEHYLRSLTAFFGLQERISFAGQISDVRAVWGQEQVLVMFSRAEGTPLALVESMLCGRPAIVSDVGGNKEWVTEPETGFIADAPVIGLARAALERAWSARESWKAIGMQAHEFGTVRIGDPGISRLLDVVSEACRSKKPVDRISGKELERTREYRALTHPTIGTRMACIAERSAQLILARWRAARAGSQERQLVGFAEPRNPD
jgi:glycosyltransferase involved in cell wall biosynthesis